MCAAVVYLLNRRLIIAIIDSAVVVDLSALPWNGVVSKLMQCAADSAG